MNRKLFNTIKGFYPTFGNVPLVVLHNVDYKDDKIAIKMALYFDIINI